jgi:hypothetical protein
MAQAGDGHAIFPGCVEGCHRGSPPGAITTARARGRKALPQYGRAVRSGARNPLPACPDGSVTKRLLCIPVPRTYACKTQGEEALWATRGHQEARAEQGVARWGGDMDEPGHG